LNLVAAAPLWLLILLALAMVAAAAEDAARFRISNITSLVVLAGAVTAAAIGGPTLALWQNGAVFLAILVLGTFAFSAGLFGGGDVKLFAAAGLWLDLRSAIGFVALVFLSGGVVAIAYLLARPFRKRATDRKSSRIPYGIAIAVGMLAVIVMDRGIPAHHERTLPPVRIIPVR
jgi:prepilin peptidase CpaA